MGTLAQPEASLAPTRGWLYEPAFDLTLLFGTLALAVASGLVVVVQPWLFVPILTLDLWLLGYHHVVATFTRIAFDAESLGKHRFLVTWLPLLVVVAVVALAAGVGVWALSSIYLYWQWFHYARQSYGVSQGYRHKAGVPIESGWQFQAIFYIVPVWGILHRSAEGPTRFLGLPIKAIPVPPVVVEVVGWAAMAALAYWVGLKCVAAAKGRLPVLHTAYMVSHFSVFVIGYVAIDSLDYGWLVLNVWHNAQYLMFVWMFNNRKFQGTVDVRHRLLSLLSQRENAAYYVLFCLTLSTAIYGALHVALRLTPFALVPAMAVVYQSINFHHYIVDAIIWRRGKSRPAQAAAGSAPAAGAA